MVRQAEEDDLTGDIEAIGIKASDADLSGELQQDNLA